MAEILIVYHTTDGHTRRISETLRLQLEQHDDRITLCSVEDAGRVDLSAFDKIVIGASVRYGRHDKRLHEFVDANQALLENRPNAFFSVNLVARKADKNTPQTNPYFRKFIERVSWSPQECAVFAGMIDYRKYRLLDRIMIRLIMWMTDGPTDPHTPVEFTDWNQVAQFARQIRQM